MLLQARDRFEAVLGFDHDHVLVGKHAREREDVAHVVVHEQHLPAFEHRLLVERGADHALLARMQFAFDEMQEQRDLVQQPFRAHGAFDDDALGVAPQLPLVLVAQVAPRVDDDGGAARLAHVLDAVQQLESGHVGEADVEHDAIERLRR